MLKLYNALTNSITDFVPAGKVATMYYCGPTVYSTQHIGNMRAFFVMDTIRRAIMYNGIPVESVMNITDVGHLTSDADTGDDKMLVASQREHRTPTEIANYYTNICLNDMKELNILTPTHIEKATNVIPEIIDFVQTLIKNGYAYETPKGIYYDVSKYADYGKLSGVKLEDKLAGARIEVDEDKRHPADFALWVKAPENHIMKWESPWGLGYPGWHIECSAICYKFFGDSVDLHGGGIEHKTIHHENEIAQNYGRAGKEVVHRWLHHEHLMVDGGKMSKSLGNVWNLQTLKQKGFRPLDLRYFFLNAHYAKQQNFTLNELASSNTALTKLYKQTLLNKNGTDEVADEVIADFDNRFLSAINDNLNCPQALGIVWELVKLPQKSPKIYKLLLKFDEVLGLDLQNADKHLAEDTLEIGCDIKELAEKRWQAKKDKNFALADSLRDELAQKGYKILDSKDGYKIEKL